MVRARLHIICGNCGCNDEFNFTTSQERDDDGMEIRVSIACNNCGTIHSLEDTVAPQENNDE